MDTNKVVRKAGEIAGTVTTVAAVIKVKRDEEHGEVKSVAVAGVPLFKRDEDGNPKVLGIPFGRWFRGARK